MLRCCLASLLAQTVQNFEVIVTDNAASAVDIISNRAICEEWGIRYENVQAKTCYHSAEEGAALAKGKYLCFPSDDSYYVPLFQEFMVQEAESRDLQLIYCDMLFDGRRMGGR